MSTALLLADPKPDTRGFLERHLTKDGFQVVDDEARPDLVLLSDADALQACRARHGDVPVIVLGEPESDAVDRVRALDGGCDDFLARPFHYEELLARIRAVLRRTSPADHEIMRAGPITADLATRTVRVDGKSISLAGKEYELLLKLMTRPDARLREGTAVAGRVGLPLARAHAHARLARLTPAAQAQRGRRRDSSSSTCGGWDTACSTLECRVAP